MNATFENLEAIDGVGPIVARSVVEWFKDKENRRLIQRLKRYVEINKETLQTGNNALKGKTFVLTGTLPTLERNEAKEMIRASGGEVSSFVSQKTDYVVAGESAGSKLDKAKELGVKIISEEEFLKMMK